MKVLVVVPAYNEEKSIEGVVRELNRHFPEGDVVVVNDGSADETEKKAGAAGAKVLTLPFNSGIGNAVQTGLRYALENGYSAAAQFDGDGQHNAADLHRIFDPVLKGETDLCIGSRFLEDREGGFRPNRRRRFGIWLISTILFLLSGLRILDVTSGFRAMNAAVIRLFCDHYPTDYPEPEAIIYLHKQGLRIQEVPVTMFERSGGISSINTLGSIYYMVKVPMSILISHLRRT